VSAKQEQMHHHIAMGWSQRPLLTHVSAHFFAYQNAAGECARKRGSIMSLGTLLVIILIIFLLGGFSGRFGGAGYGLWSPR
jgi:hypothetical protein